MKSFWNEFLYLKKQKRVRESVMLARIGVSVFLIVACLAAMSFTAYAYFTSTVSSGIIQLQSASFDADISVVAPDSSPIPLIPTGDGRFQASLTAHTPYTVTLTAAGTAETGFCVITSDISNKVYCTQQLGVDRTAQNRLTSTITFTLTVDVSSTVTFFPHWGTSTYYEKYSTAEHGDCYILHQDPPVVVQITADRTLFTDSVQQEEPTVPTTEEIAPPPPTPPAPIIPVPTIPATEPPATTTPPETEATVPETTAPTIAESLPSEPIETEPQETQPDETEPEETEPTQPDNTESTQPEEITTSTTEPEATNPTDSI